ncbi:MAG TPA: DJ-1/PfpI family protein [Actinokineospora sp.]|jgi:transcriptional regulator GlxA family with amidase domain|nr:DJ-1/PfpI family protein [Actinokineospora sp.]
MSTHSEPHSEAPRIGILVFHHVDELDVVGAYEPLAKAARCPDHPGALAPPMLLGTTPRVSGSNGLSIGDVRPLGDARRCHALIVPGGTGIAEACGDEVLVRTVREAYESGGPMYSVCSGAFLLAAAGVLAGRRVAVHHGKTARLAEAAGPGATVGSSGMTVHGRITSVGGFDSGVKALTIGFAALARFSPTCVACVSERMEVRAS